MFWRKKPAKPSAPPATSPEVDEDESKVDHPSTQFLTGDQATDRRSVEVLLEAIARVSESRDQDIDSLLADIVDRSIEITGAERGLLILETKGGEHQVRVARSNERANIAEDLRFSTSIVKKVLSTQKPVRATVQSDSDALELGRSVFDLKLRAVMCVPMAARPPADDSGVSSSTRGVLYVDSRAATREFNRRDLGLFAALSQHISIALEQARLGLEAIEKTRLENSLEVASAIQSGLMPRIPDDLEGFEVHGWYRPAERTSGDFFDFVKAKDQRLAVVIGDVSGHGIGPALVTATAQATLRSYLKVLPDVASAVTMLNADMAERVEDGMFLTLLLMAVEEGGVVEWINAGHHAPFLWRGASSGFEDVDDHSMALGYLDDFEYGNDARVELASGDVLVAFTDGLIEAHRVDDRDDLFGEERARAVVQRSIEAGRDARGITEDLAEAALEFSQANHDDDITLVVLRRL